jgi:segregation and condensation protein A
MSEPEPTAARGQDYVVTLPVFEGPLDLLLHLIQKHELEILDIPVSFITEKYLEYISLMQALSIDVTSEYLLMAATLVHIKSKSLLPAGTVADDGDEDGLGEGVDPREELIRRLLEYQKYKQAAAELNERGALGRDVFTRSAPPLEDQGPAPLAPVEIWSLLDAFAKVLARAKVKIEHEISFDKLSITERIQQLCDQLAEKRRCTFEELFDARATRIDLVITFLALLEMTRLKLTRLYQVDPLAPIHIELTGDRTVPPPAEASVTTPPEPPVHPTMPLEPHTDVHRAIAETSDAAEAEADQDSQDDWQPEEA